MDAEPSIFELRQYTLKPSRRDDLIELFEREFVETQQAVGITLAGTFCDAGRPDRFVWIRGFRDMAARKASLEAFYDGRVWRKHREAANDTMVDSEDVLLLRPAPGFAALRVPLRVRGPLFCATYHVESDDAGIRLQPLLERAGGRIVTAFVTEPSENTFPRLPVRGNEHVFVALTGGIAPETLQGTKPSELARLIPTRRSAISLLT